MNNIHTNTNQLQNNQTFDWLRRTGNKVDENQIKSEINQKLNESVGPKRFPIKPMVDHEKYFNRK